MLLASFIRLAQFEAFADAAEDTRPEFKSVGFTLDPAVFREFKAKPNDIVLFYPKIFHSKFEDKTATFNKVIGPVDYSCHFFNKIGTSF